MRATLAVTRLGLPALVALVVLAHAGDAHAHPPGEVRLPIDWSDSPCLTIIDRSQDPVLEFGYGILGEEEPPTEDEPPDSHTHQFFAFCRDRNLLEPLPNWISQTDVDAAAAYNLVSAEIDPSELLTDHPNWAGCWSRILDDDERRPINTEAAAEPVPWDTSELPAGTYVIEGYTYEPPFNLWSPNPGVFKVVDDPDPAASQPAAALDYPEATKFVGASVDISGCVDAMPGSTMTLSWAAYDTILDPELPPPSADALEWQILEADIAVENGAFSLPWLVPEEAAGTNVVVRLEVTDPMDRSWTAHAQSVIGVISISGGDDETGTGDTGEGPGIDPEGEGCSCRTGMRSGPGHGPIGALWGLMLLVGLGRAHRRQSPRT